MANVLEMIRDYDPVRDGGLSFPSTTDYTRFKGKNSDFMILAGTGAPSTNHNNAPNGSLYHDYTNLKWYIKTAAASWTVFGSAT